MLLVHATMGLSQEYHVAEVLAPMGAAPVIRSLVFSSHVVTVEHVGHQVGDQIASYMNKDRVTCMYM